MKKQKEKGAGKEKALTTVAEEEVQEASQNTMVGGAAVGGDGWGNISAYGRDCPS